jgi:hypothetical protein
MTFAKTQTRLPRGAIGVMTAALSLGISLVPGAASATAQAQAPTTQPASGDSVVYPAKGQSAKQQNQDKYECYEWAKGQSGFDPAQATQTAATSQPTPSGGGMAMAGMARGAAGGAAIAELSHHDAGRGAAAGVLGSAVLEKVKAQQAAQARQQQSGQQQAIGGQQRSTYERALGACLEARGYTVK